MIICHWNFIMQIQSIDIIKINFIVMQRILQFIVLVEALPNLIYCSQYFTIRNFITLCFHFFQIVYVLIRCFLPLKSVLVHFCDILSSLNSIMNLFSDFFDTWWIKYLMTYWFVFFLIDFKFIIWCIISIQKTFVVSFSPLLADTTATIPNFSIAFILIFFWLIFFLFFLTSIYCNNIFIF